MKETFQPTSNKFISRNKFRLFKKIAQEYLHYRSGTVSADQRDRPDRSKQKASVPFKQCTFLTECICVSQLVCTHTMPIELPLRKRLRLLLCVVWGTQTRDKRITAAWITNIIYRFGEFLFWFSCAILQPSSSTYFVNLFSSTNLQLRFSILCVPFVISSHVRYDITWSSSCICSGNLVSKQTI